MTVDVFYRRGGANSETYLETLTGSPRQIRSYVQNLAVANNPDYVGISGWPSPRSW